MASIATVKPKLDKAIGKAGETVQFSFAVTNTSGKKLKMGASVEAKEPTDKSWFKINGDREREFQPDDLDQFDVEVNLPNDAAPGTYNFNLLVYPTDAPCEDYEEGPTVSVEITKTEAEPIPQKQEKDGVPWWVYAKVSLTVEKELIQVPSLIRKSYADSRVTLETLGLSVGRVNYKKTGGSPDAVVDQEPKAGVASGRCSQQSQSLVG